MESLAERISSRERYGSKQEAEVNRMTSLMQKCFTWQMFYALLT